MSAVALLRVRVCPDAVGQGADRAGAPSKQAVRTVVLLQDGGVKFVVGGEDKGLGGDGNSSAAATGH